jgi:hypothetical protein
MIKSEFKKVAKDYKGEYSFKDKQVLGRGMSKLPITYHKLVVKHNGTDITLKYEYGNHYLATVEMKINNANEEYIFKLKKTSPYIQLFAKNRKSLIVITELKEAKLKIEAILISTGLEKIAKQTQFDPKIDFVKNGSELEIKTRIYLGFKETEKTISKLLKLYIALYDLISVN